MHTEFSDEDLHAFIDGELASARQKDMEKAVKSDSVLAERIAAFQSDKALLAGALEALLHRPLPKKWLKLIDSHEPAKAIVWSRDGFLAIAAALLIAVTAGIAYWNSVPHEEAIIEEALSARSDLGKATIAPADAAEANNIIASALRARLKAPDLSRMDYTLTGIRVYTHVPGGSAVELRYRHSDGRIFTVYVRHPSSAARFDQFKQGDLRVCIWQDDELGAVMTGRMSAAEMQRLASLAYSGLVL
ncbi:MAG: hypothetical protein WAW96_03060 [Alphaproteobacteria bacterium]